MKLVIANDHAGLKMKWEIMDHLRAKGHEVINVGTDSSENCAAQIPGYQAARMVADGLVEGGILICGTGIGISLAANKVKGIRGCVCSEPYSAKMAREKLNANIIAFGARIIGSEMAKMIVDQWLEARYQPDDNQKNLDMIREIEETQSLRHNDRR